MEIRIGGYLEASFLLEREPKQWHALVMLDSGKEPTDFVQAASAPDERLLRSGESIRGVVGW